MGSTWPALREIACVAARLTSHLKDHSKRSRLLITRVILQGGAFSWVGKSNLSLCNDCEVNSPESYIHAYKQEGDGKNSGNLPRPNLGHLAKMLALWMGGPLSMSFTWLFPWPSDTSLNSSMEKLAKCESDRQTSAEQTEHGTETCPDSKEG